MKHSVQVLENLLDVPVNIPFSVLDPLRCFLDGVLRLDLGLREQLPELFPLLPLAELSASASLRRKLQLGQTLLFLCRSV